MYRWFDGDMRTSNLLCVAFVLTGCAVSTGNYGKTRGELAGSASVVFTNATSEPMCNMQIQRDGAASFGDNWLPASLPSGRSIDLKLQPGTYMATWNTCKRDGHPYHAGTLVGQNAFIVKDGRDAVQLFAYVADKVAPTKRAALRDFHTLIKFPGQICDGVVAAVDSTSRDKAPTVVAETNMSEFVDTSIKKAPRKKPMKASLARKHDLSDGRVGFAEKAR
jgi:hypothetical protein